jgi:hypothetical protein
MNPFFSLTVAARAAELDFLAYQLLRWCQWVLVREKNERERNGFMNGVVTVMCYGVFLQLNLEHRSSTKDTLCCLDQTYVTDVVRLLVSDDPL